MHKQKPACEKAVLPWKHQIITLTADSTGYKVIENDKNTMPAAQRIVIRDCLKY